MPVRRRRTAPPPDPNLLQTDQHDGLTYPTLSATWAGVDPADLERRHARARQLRDGGYGAVQW